MSSFFTNESNIMEKSHYFKNWVEENFLPCGIVFSTESSRNMILKNNLTPSQFLRPFGDLSNIFLEIKIKNIYENTIKNFKIDFFDSENFHKNENNILSYFYNCLSNENNLPQFSLNSIHLNKKNYFSFIDNQKYFSKNYFNECEKVIFEYCYFNENEIYQQPLLFVYLIDINDDFSKIDEMKKNFPNIVKDIYDTHMIDLIIILNDKSDKTKYKTGLTKKEELLIYSKTSYLYFEINGNENKECDNFELFSKYFHRLEIYDQFYSKKKLGNLLTENEIDIIRQNMSNFFKNDFIKKLCKKIYKLDDSINKNYSLFNYFSSISLENCIFFNSTKFDTSHKEQLTMSIILFFLRAYKESYSYIKNLYNLIKNLNYPKNKASLFLYKTLVKFIKIDDKSKVEKDEMVNLYIIYNNIFLNRKHTNKIYVGIIRALLIYLKMLENNFNYKNINEFIGFLKKYMKYFTKYEYKIIYGLLLEKIGNYYLFTDIPYFRFFTYHLIRWCPDYWNFLSKNRNENESLIYRYLLYILGEFFDMFKLKINSNDNITHSFYLIKTHLLKYLIKSCYLINYNEGIIYFYLILLDLYKIPENLILKKEDLKILEEEYLKIFNDISQYISNINFPIDTSDLINFDKSSILIITKIEEDILKTKYKTNFYNNFKKYIFPSLNIYYSILKENDLQNFKYIDRLTNEKKIFNYFINKKIDVNINETIRIIFIFSNPFPITINFESICFIFDNELLVECEKKNLIIQGLEKKQIELSLKFIKKGKVSIIGISYIREGIHKVKNIFNYKIKTNLYNQLKEDDIKISNDKKKIRKKLTEYNIVDNKDKRCNYSFNILDYNSNINITIANNEKSICFYQYEFYYFPIKIINNSKYHIINFTIFLEIEEKNIFIPKYFFDEKIDISKECIVYIPIISLEYGKKFLNIVFKFEGRKEEIEVKKFILELNIFKSYNIDYIDNFIIKENDIIIREIIIKIEPIDNQLINQNLFKDENNFIVPNDYTIVNKTVKFQNNCYTNEMKIYSNKGNHCFIKKKIFDNLKFEEEHNQRFIDHFLKSIEKNNFIFKFFYLEKENKIKNLLYIHQIINYTNEKRYNEYRIRHIIEQHLTISYKIEEENEKEKYFTVNIELELKKFVTNLKIKLINIKIGIDNQIETIFEWIGLKQYKIKNFNINVVNKTLNCIVLNKVKSTLYKEFEDELNKIYIEIETIEHFIFKYSYLYN